MKRNPELQKAIQALRCKESRKLKYRYEKDAWIDAWKMYQERLWDNSGVYVCPFCRYYHLSSKRIGIVPQWLIEEFIGTNQK